MDKCVDLSQSRTCFVMTKREISAVISVLSVRSDINVLPVLYQIRKFNFISNRKYTECKEAIKGKTIRESISYLLNVVYHFIPFNDFVLILRLTDQDFLAKELVREKFRNVYKSPGRINILHSRRIQRFYKIQKGHVDNKIFNLSTTKYLLSVIRGLDETIRTPTAPFELRQESLERKVAFCVLLVQQYFEVHKRIAAMYKLTLNVPDDLDRNSLQMVFHSKMALTEAREKHKEKCEGHIRAANVVFDNCNPCFATLSTLHDIMYIKRTVYNQNPSEKNLKEVFDAGYRIIQSLEKEREEVQEFWRRLALSFLILCLLRINSAFEMDDIEHVSPINIAHAKYFLKEAYRGSDNIEARRRMILTLCNARAHEPDDIDKAIAYTEEALSYSEAGTFFKHERKNIVKYLGCLMRKKCLQWRFILKWLFIISLPVFMFAILFVYSDMFCAVFLHLFLSGD